MRRRAFTPDALGSLEARVVLSAAGHLHAPFALDAETYGQGIYWSRTPSSSTASAAISKDSGPSWRPTA